MEEQKRKRGRPPKPKPPVDPTPKKRGRPPKPKPLVEEPKRKRGRPPKQKEPPIEPPKEPTKRPQDTKTGRFIARDVIQTDEQIDEYNKSLVGNQMYSKDIGAGERMQLVVSYIAREIENLPPRINFSDTELVRQTVVRYIRSCDRYGVMPTQQGLARACGIDRHSMAKYISRHPDSPTAQLLLSVIDAFSEALTQASLNGSVQPIVGIFVQKALYGLRETDPIAQPQENPIGEATDNETLMKKYGELTTEQ